MLGMNTCTRSIEWIGSLFWYVNAYRMLGMNICTRSMYSMVSLFWYVNAYRMLGMNTCTRSMYSMVSCKSLQDVGYEYMHHKSSDFVDISGFSCGNTFFIFKNTFANFIFKIIKKVLQKVMH